MFYTYNELSIHIHIFTDYTKTVHKTHLEYDINLLIFEAY